MKNKIIPTYHDHPMFDGISPSDCRLVLNCLGCIKRSFGKDQIIHSPDPGSKQIGLIISGCVHTIKEDFWGRCTFLDYTKSDGIIGETLLGNEFMSRGVIFRAAEPTTILFLPVDRILHPCTNACAFHHSLTRNLFSRISMKNVALTEKIEITSKPSLREKILTYLSMEIKKCGSDTFTVPLSRTEMADYLCTNRSALSRELANMKKDGILDYNQRNFHLFKVLQED